MKPVDIVTVLWGRNFAEFFLRVCARSLLAPGNIPALAAATDCRYQIHTDAPTAAQLRASPVLARLSAVVRLDIREHDALPGDIYQAATAFHQRALDAAYARNAAVIFITPDFMVADGSLAALTRRIAAGERLVMLCPLRLDQAKLPAEIDPGPGSEPICLPPRRLVRLALTCLHRMTSLSFWDSAEFGSWPHHVVFPAGDIGVVVRGYHLHPLYVDPLVQAGLEGETFDASFVARAVPDDATISVVTDSDEICIFECSTPQKTYAGPVPSDQKFRFASQLIEQATFPRHLAWGAKPIFLHAEDLDGREETVVARSRHLTEILTRRAEMSSWSLFLVDPLVACVRARRLVRSGTCAVRRPARFERLFLRVVLALESRIWRVYRRYEQRNLLPDDASLWRDCLREPGFWPRALVTCVLLAASFPWIMADILRGRWRDAREWQAQARVGPVPDAGHPLIASAGCGSVSSVLPDILGHPPPTPVPPPMTQFDALQAETERLRHSLIAAETELGQLRRTLERLEGENAQIDIRGREHIIRVLREVAHAFLNNGDVERAIAYLGRATNLAEESKARFGASFNAERFDPDMDAFYHRMLRVMETLIAQYKPFKTKKGDGDRTILSTVLWGRRYVELFTTVLVPCLLADENLPFLRERSDVVFQIITTPTYKPLLAKTDSMRKLEALCTVQYIMFPDTTLSGMTARYSDPRRWHVSGALHHISAVHAKDYGANLVILPPDIVFANSLLKAIWRRRQEGFHAVLATGPLVHQDSMLEALARHRTNEGALSVSARALSEMAVTNFDDATDGFVKKPVNNEVLNGRVNLLWRVENGLLSHAAHQHPLLISSDAWHEGVRFAYDTVDTSLLSRVIPFEAREKRIYVTTDFDELAFFNLSTAAVERMIGRSAFRMEEFGNLFWPICGDLNLWLFRKPVLIHGRHPASAAVKSHATAKRDFERICDIVTAHRPGSAR